MYLNKISNISLESHYLFKMMAAINNVLISQPTDQVCTKIVYKCLPLHNCPAFQTYLLFDVHFTLTLTADNSV